LVAKLFSKQLFFTFISAKLLSSAESLVQYCKEQPMLREVTQAKYLRARTLFRDYHHITKSMVMEGRGREVDRLEGMLQC
jgi:hypothetical protein